MILSRFSLASFRRLTFCGNEMFWGTQVASEINVPLFHPPLLPYDRICSRPMSDHSVCWKLWSSNWFHRECHLSDVCGTQQEEWKQTVLLPDNPANQWSTENKDSPWSPPPTPRQKSKLVLDQPGTKCCPKRFCWHLHFTWKQLYILSSMVSHGMVSAFLTQRFSGFFFNLTGWLKSTSPSWWYHLNLYISFLLSVRFLYWFPCFSCTLLYYIWCESPVISMFLTWFFVIEQALLIFPLAPNNSALNHLLQIITLFYPTNNLKTKLCSFKTPKNYKTPNFYKKTVHFNISIKQFNATAISSFSLFSLSLLACIPDISCITPIMICASSLVGLFAPII